MGPSCFAAVHLRRSTVISKDFSDVLKHLFMFECQQFRDSLLVVLFLKALLIDCRFLEVKWPLLSEPPQYETLGLLKSDVTFVETLCTQCACQEGSNVTIWNPFLTLFFQFFSHSVVCLQKFPSSIGLVIVYSQLAAPLVIIIGRKKG